MNFDDLVDDQDPQSAMAAQGLKKIGQSALTAMESGPAISKAPNEGVVAEDDPLTTLAGTAIGAPLAGKLMEGGAEILGNEIGSIGNIGAFKPSPGAAGKLGWQETQPLDTAMKEAVVAKEPGQLTSLPGRSIQQDIPSTPEAAEIIAKARGMKAVPQQTLNKQVPWQEGPELKPNYGAVSSDIRDAGPTNYGNTIVDGEVQEMPKAITPSGGILERAKTMFPKAKNMKELYEAADARLSPGHPIMKALQQAKERKSFADGGAVSTPSQDFDSLQADPQSVAQSTPNSSEPSFDSLQDDQEKYGTLGQQAKAGLEGLGQGLFGPLAPAAERLAGVNPEDIRGRAEANPVTHYGSEIAGLVAPALVTGGASAAAQFTQEGLLKALGTQLGLHSGETLAGKIGMGAAKSAIDNMIITGSDEASKLILQDPNQSAQTALTSIGLSGLIGAGAGAAFGAVSPLWKAASQSKAGQMVEDFKSRINEHLNNPEPVQAVTNELTDLWQGIKDVPVFGDTGIKSEAIAKAMPEMSNKIANQASDISDYLSDAQDKLAQDPNKGLLDGQIARYKQALNTDDPGQIFNATQDLKKQLQEWGRYNKAIVPLAERPFRDAVQDLAHNLRESLEDTSVWGDTAKIQQKINSSFSKFKPTLDDIEKTFTTKVADERQFDPGKVNTYMNQLGKPNAEIKMQKVENFLEQAGKYKSAIDDAYASIGAPSPFKATPMTATTSTLQQKTLGSRIADAFISKGLTEAGGKTVGAGVGGALGSLIGHPELGAILGGHSLGPFFSSVLPGITKSLIGGETSAAGFKVASDYAAQVAKGNNLLNNATAAIFKAGKEVLPSSLHPSAKEIDKLDDKLKELQINVDPILGKDNQLQHYMPNHSQALDETSANAITYLNSLRTGKDKANPLDSEPVMNAQQKSEFKNALTIAQQPITILQKIKDGTITASDIKILQSLYPSLYSGMNQKLTDNLINAVNNKETIPYKTRVSLSMFMAQPLDSTMSPQAIQSAQLMPQGPVPAQAPQGGAPKGVKSSPALQKLPSMYQTADQSRQVRSQMRK